MNLKKIDNKKEWDSYLPKSANTSFFASWEWAEFQRQTGFEFETLGLFNKNELVGLLPVTVVKAKRGNYLHLRHAPLIDWQNETVIDETFQFLKELAYSKGAQFVRISPWIPDTDQNRSMFKRNGFIPSTTHCMDAELSVVIDLQKPEDQIMSEMRKNTRYSIRKAEKVGVTVESTSGTEFFNDFEKIYLDTVARQKWVAHSVKNIRKEYDIFTKAGSARMFIAKYKKNPIAASIFVMHKDQVVYHHSGSLTKYRNIPSTYLIQWSAIKYFKEKGYKEYNFWGVCPKDELKHPWYGLSLFKRGFAKTEVKYIHAHDIIYKPFAYLTRVYEFLESKLKGY